MQPITENAVTQIALIVDDIEKYSAAWAKVFQIRVPQWFMTDPPEKAHTKYEGKASDARAKLAFIKARNITIELIEPIGPDSVWAEHLRKHGPSVHHIAFDVKDLPEAIKSLGLAVSQTGDYTGGCYTYLRGETTLGVDVELLKNG